MTMDPKEIERHSCIYDISKLHPGHKMWLYFNEMNKAVMNLCMDNPDLLRNNKLTELAQKAVHESGYRYKKKAPRFKPFWTGRWKKRQYVSDVVKTKRLREIQEDVDNTNTQISLLTWQQEKQINVKQFGLAANVKEQIPQIQGKIRKLEQELTLLQVKRKECQRQKTRVFAAQDTSAIQTTKITAFTAALQKLRPLKTKT